MKSYSLILNGTVELVESNCLPDELFTFKSAETALRRAIKNNKGNHILISKLEKLLEEVKGVGNGTAERI